MEGSERPQAQDAPRTHSPRVLSPHGLSRRALLKNTTAAGLALAAGGPALAGLADAAVRPGVVSASPAAPYAEAATLLAQPAASPGRPAGLSGAELRPQDPFAAIFAAMERYPLVGLGERHMLQEMHDFITALLLHPDLPRSLTDIAVEFGNSAYQDLVDRFLLTDQPVARADLVQVWRQVGDPAWNAPVYEQFFRTVRAVNWLRRPQHRLRVLLGQPPVTLDQVAAQPANRALFDTFEGTMDDHYAAVIEREVLAKGRRALLIAGSGHLMRSIHSDDDKPHHLNAAGQVLARHPGALYTVDLLMLPPASTLNPKLPLSRYAAAKLAGWPRPALATLAGTWLGNVTEQHDPWINSLSYRALTPAAVRFGAQADAILYLGPGEVLTSSQPDPAIYHWGTYPQRLRAVDALTSRALGQPVSQLSYGIHWATVGPSWFNLFSS